MSVLRTITQLRNNCLPCVVGLVALFAGLAEGATVQFKPQALVTGEVVRLGDVANIYDFNPQITAQLQQIVLRPAPASGVKVRMHIDEICSRLKASGVNMLAIDIQGSTIVEIGTHAGSYPVQQVAYSTPDPTSQVRQLQKSAEALKTSIQQYLAARQVVVKPEQIELEVNRQDVPLLRHVLPSAYLIQGGRAPWNGTQELKVTLADPQQSMQTILVRATIKTGLTALVPRYQIPRGQALTAEDFEVVAIDRDADGFITSYEEIKGKEAVQPIAAGRPVRQNQVQPVVLVHRNSMVKVHARVGGVEVNSYFKALQEGSLEDTIQVEPQWKTKTRPTPINVKVTGVNEAEIETGGTLTGR